MTDPRTPRTEAGRRLMRSTETQDDGTWSGLDLTAFRDGILAIEAEASTLASSERLAAALHASMGTHSRPLLTRQICPGAHMHIKEADAILAHLTADPALSDPDAERQRAIGEAVERLPAWSRIDRTDVRWRVLLYRGDAEMRKGYGTAMDMVARDALPEAIDAVLPAAQEPERG
jgi:hypothetical protein